KIKAKQIRFLQYRGFDMSVIMKAIARTSDEE
ncbi:MAG TPA: RecX family transcriptional regulator, partial [Acinetobacter junii]|nr:RecX family transcriptional regulator [Acinetobacter junii]